MVYIQDALESKYEYFCIDKNMLLDLQKIGIVCSSLIIGLFPEFLVSNVQVMLSLPVLQIVRD